MFPNYLAPMANARRGAALHYRRPNQRRHRQDEPATFRSNVNVTDCRKLVVGLVRTLLPTFKHPSTTNVELWVHDATTVVTNVKLWMHNAATVVTNVERCFIRVLGRSNITVKPNVKTWMHDHATVVTNVKLWMHNAATVVTNVERCFIRVLGRSNITVKPNVKTWMHDHATVVTDVKPMHNVATVVTNV